MLTSRSRILLFVIVILLLGGLITLLSGEIESEPWLVIVDIGQLAVAALIGAYVLPFALRQLERITKSAAR